MEKRKRAVLRYLHISVSKDLAVQIITLAVIFLIAWLIRLHPSQMEKTRAGLGQFGDSNLYHQLAYNLCVGNGFSGVDDGTAYGGGKKQTDMFYEPAVTRAPGYPFFMCQVYRVFGNTAEMNSASGWQTLWIEVRNIQAFLDASLCLTVFFMVRMISPGGYRAALAAAALYGLSVYNIYYTQALLSESVTTFLITWSLFFFISGLRRRTLWGWVGAGIALGLTSLTRPEYLLFIPSLAIIMCLIRVPGAPSPGIKAAAVFLLCSLVMVLPWTARNYFQFKKIIPVSTGGLGYNLFLGTFETNDNWRGWGKYPDDIFSNDEEKEKISVLTRSFGHFFKQGSIRARAVDREFMQMAVGRMMQDPLLVLKIWLQRLPRLWFQFYVQMYGDKEASGLFFIFYLIFAIVAVAAGTWTEKVMMMPAASVFIYLNIVFLPLHIEPRYVVSAMPALICLTGVGIGKAYALLTGQKSA